MVDIVRNAVMPWSFSAGRWTRIRWCDASESDGAGVPDRRRRCETDGAPKRPDKTETDRQPADGDVERGPGDVEVDRMDLDASSGGTASGGEHPVPTQTRSKMDRGGQQRPRAPTAPRLANDAV
jgi:hypothetical protein